MKECRWCGTSDADADVQAVGAIPSNSGPGWSIYGCGECRRRKSIVLLADQTGWSGMPQRSDGTPVL